jgi:hypothetical protein
MESAPKVMRIAEPAKVFVAGGLPGADRVVQTANPATEALGTADIRLTQYLSVVQFCLAQGSFRLRPRERVLPC